MQPPPDRIDGFPVVCYTAVDGRHAATRTTRHEVGGQQVGSAAGLAVCEADGSFYLFYCDDNWEPMTDTWHDSVEKAKAQAEFEYVGSAATWRHAG